MAFNDLLISRPVSVVIPVVSSVAGCIRKYIESILPAGYIRDYFIDTEIPLTRDLTRNKFNPMQDSQLAVRKLPLMSVKVETVADSSDFTTGTTFWTSTRFLNDPTLLSRVIADDHNLRYLGFESDRMVMHIGLSFTVETELRAAELMMYLRRTLPIGYKFYLNDINIATELPRDILRAIWLDMVASDSTLTAAFYSLPTFKCSAIRHKLLNRI